MTLQEYLGSLIISINQARVLADVESARIAKSYAKDDLLKHFSVPRFRADDVELDIPIAIDGFNSVLQGNEQPVDNTLFNTTVYGTMKDSARVPSFSRSTAVKLNSRIAKCTRKLEEDIKSSIPKKKAFEEYSNDLSNLLGTVVSREKTKMSRTEEMESTFKKSIRELLYDQLGDDHQKVMADANVVFEPNKLREIPAENVIRIKMKLFEDGMEWHHSENSDGSSSSQLLPE